MSIGFLPQDAEIKFLFARSSNHDIKDKRKDRKCILFNINIFISISSIYFLSFLKDNCNSLYISGLALLWWSKIWIKDKFIKCRAPCEYQAPASLPPSRQTGRQSIVAPEWPPAQLSRWAPQPRHAFGRLSASLMTSHLDGYKRITLNKLKYVNMVCAACKMDLPVY